MRIHHLSCGTMCPLGKSLFFHLGTPLPARHLVCHCLLIETDRGLVLVDTGMGPADLHPPNPRVPAFFRSLNRPHLAEGEPAMDQLIARGFDPRDVRHIILTHLDFDHAGGIEDFPWAEVHVMRAEHEAACRPRGFIGRSRYLKKQWDQNVRWRHYEASAGESWFGFSAVRGLAGLPPELLLIPLPGHTVGHAGVAVATNSGWLLHAGDAYFDYLEMRPNRPGCAPGRRFYQWMMDSDRQARLHNRDRLRQLVAAHSQDVEILCSHDPIEFLAATATSGMVDRQTLAEDWHQAVPG
jgi:glyoxylase-like metal-dependent hydrolase (beta-lactamase superfamily II)